MAAQPPDHTNPSVTLDPRGLAQLAADIQRIAKQQRERAVIAIAGVPGSGKSTLARALAIHLNRAAGTDETLAGHYAATLGLDAFHLSNDRLAKLNLTDRKGSPATFDAQGYFKLLSRCRDPKVTIDLPVYDRQVHEPVYTGKTEDRVGPVTRVLITEGNYLLLDTLPWTVIDEMADLRLLLETPMEHARTWLIRRHIATGRSMEQAMQRVQANDDPNTRLVLDRSRHPDRIVRWPESAFAG